MLVLTRKLGKQVVIDGHIVVTVIEVIGGQVKLGIEAPQQVGVVRGERVSATAEKEFCSHRNVAQPNMAGVGSLSGEAGAPVREPLVARPNRSPGPTRPATETGFLQRLRRIPR